MREKDLKNVLALFLIITQTQLVGHCDSDEAICAAACRHGRFHGD